jgi:SSS family solute:Na+ symporter
VNLARDFYQQLTPREVPSVELRKVGQVAVVVFATLAFTLAVLMPDIVTAIVFAYTLYSAGLLVPLYAGYLWRGATPAAGMLSVIGGGGTALVWYILGEPLGLPPIVPAIAVALVAIVLVSLLTEGPSREQLRVFDA